MTSARGYMLEAEFDGHTLTARGTNKASRIALAGADHAAGDVVLPVDRIASAEFKKASRIVNGEMVIHTTDERKYQLHFRRKQMPEFVALDAELQQALATR